MEKIFGRPAAQTAVQWDLVSLQIGGFDIQQIPTDSIVNWLKCQRKLKKLHLVHCGMTPGILAAILQTLPGVFCEQARGATDEEPCEVAFD